MIIKEKIKNIDINDKIFEELKLEYKDFKNPTMDEIGVTAINKYWGSLNKMKTELGLEIVQESMVDKQLSKEDFDKTVQNIIEFIKSDDRNFTTTREIDDNKNWASYSTLDRMSKKYYNISFTEYLKTFGVIFGKQGNGINYDFKDGEHVTSQFEYMFSKYLKENGFEYNKSYLRDVKYRDFVSNYKGNMNCDYVIDIDGIKLYIEIAGIIADYKTWYYEDKIITYSKSKEKYRQKLKEKEQMLKDNGLNYFILFPCDLTKENFENILFNRSTELKDNIEQFHKNNIDWNKVRKIGELDYSQDIIREDKRRKKYRKEAV